MRTAVAVFVSCVLCQQSLGQTSAERILEELDNLNRAVGRVELLQKSINQDIARLNARPGESPRYDGDKEAMSRWPKSIPFPDDAVRYKPAKFTQRLFNQGTTEKVSRKLTKIEWQVSGGMEGITGWTSDLFKKKGPNHWVWKGVIGVKASGGTAQGELGWKREYFEGTYFFDLLSYNGRPFELRKREFVDGKWDSAVEFRDKAARPPGYNGLKRTCASCHNQAGSGNYAEALISGGHTVFSAPFPELEK